MIPSRAVYLMHTERNVLLIIKRDVIVEVISGIFGHEEITALVAAAGICMMATMNDMTAPLFLWGGGKAYLADTGIAGIRPSGSGQNGTYI